MAPRYPLLFQINTRVWLTALSRASGREATLDDIPDHELDHLAQLGFDWIWMLRTSEDPDSQLPATPSTNPLVEMLHWLGCAIACASVA
jgi:hypothetical protein